jgi:putative acetyltransferase
MVLEERAATSCTDRTASDFRRDSAMLRRVSEIETRREPLDSARVRALIAALNAELLQRYPEEGATHFRLDAGEVAPGRGAFLVASRGGKAIGCGAVRRLDDGVAEIKRMYVRPGARCAGVGAIILAALEAEARALGVRRLVLETGERQPEALVLYRRAGFTVIPRFGEYVDSALSLCLGKDLVRVGRDD